MKTPWPYMTIMVLLTACGFLLFKVNKLASENERKDSIISEKTDSVRHWKTESGRNAIEKTAAIATPKEFKEAYPKFAEELKKEFDVKVKDLKAFVRAEFQAQGELIGRIDTGTFKPEGLTLNPELRLSTFNRRAKLSDGYLSQELFWTDGSNDITGKYTYVDTLTYGFRTKKKWFLGNEKLYGFGGLKNPHAKITSATNVLIDDYKDKRFVVGPYVGYSISGNRVDFGVSLTYAIWKF